LQILDAGENRESIALAQSQWLRLMDKIKELGRFAKDFTLRAWRNLGLYSKSALYRQLLF
jgi:hypothetical protein